MDESTARYLTGPEGAALLDAVARLPGDAARRVLTLRKQGVAPGLAAGAAEVTEARRRAAARRYPDADRLFFTQEALAQATSPALAAFHARALAPYARGGAVADLCCGVGMDALAFAEAGAGEVIAVDLDPARLVFAEANARVRGVSARIRFVRADVTDIAAWHDASLRAAFLDPARRTGDRRVSRRGDLYSPPLSFVAELAARVEALGVKLSPALLDEELAELGGGVAFLSEGRECKEAFVVRSPDAAAGFAARLLPEDVTLPATGEEAPVGPVGAYVLDPDPAAIRAGALGALCARAGGNAALISPDDAYLTADAPPSEPRLASTYRVLHAETYSPRRLGKTLKERGVGRLVVKKRRFPQEPDALARELKLPGRGEEATLVLVQQGKQFLAVLCEPVTP